MSYNMKARREAEELVNALVAALRDRQVNRGENYLEASAYTLGYLASAMTSVLAESPKGRKYFKDTLEYVKESK